MTEGARTIGQAARVALGLYVAQACVAVIAVAYVFFRRISIPHCGLECDFELLARTGDVFALAALVLLVVVGACLLVVGMTTRPGPFPSCGWILPTFGILLTLAGAVVADHFSDIAMLFR